jgi:hypothetical protein
MQWQAARSDLIDVARKRLRQVEVGSDEMHVSVRGWFNDRVSVAIDREVQHRAAELIAVWAEIRSATGQSQP